MQNISNSFFELLNKIQEKKKGDDIQQYFAEVADYLFKHVAIQAGETRFTFAEIEFYYYKEGEFEGPICFESSEEKKYFGGILIRSIKRGSELIAGPMRCSDEIMNSCDGELPYLVYCETACETPVSTIRYGIEADKNQNMKFCFYIEPETWNRKREGVLVADKATGRYKNVSKTDYYIAEPKKR